MMSRTRRYTLLVSPPPQHPLEPLSEVADSLDVTLWGHGIGSGNGVHWTILNGRQVPFGLSL
jgi:hypothetical protein